MGETKNKHERIFREMEISNAVKLEIGQLDRCRYNGERERESQSGHPWWKLHTKISWHPQPFCIHSNWFNQFTSTEYPAFSTSFLCCPNSIRVYCHCVTFFTTINVVFFSCFHFHCIASILCVLFACRPAANVWQPFAIFQFYFFRHFRQCVTRNRIDRNPLYSLNVARR